MYLMVSYEIGVVILLDYKMNGWGSNSGSVPEPRLMSTALQMPARPKGQLAEDISGIEDCD